MFPQLISLDLGDNLLTSVMESGLASCSQLQALRLANNRIVDPGHAAYFALLPSLRVLDVRGNPFATPRTRCVSLARCATVAPYCTAKMPRGPRHAWLQGGKVVRTPACGHNQSHCTL
jgi:hypothetical protein